MSNLKAIKRENTSSGSNNKLRSEGLIPAILYGGKDANQNISIEEYEKLPSFFNPVYFDAEEWVLMAKNAGMKYITITSRH